MKGFHLGRMLLYFVPQGGALSQANTIYVWPSLAFTQEQQGIDFGAGQKYCWLLTVSFLFWTVGAAW